MDTAVPDRIVRFIKRHHVMTLATSDGQGVWCSNLFYVYVAAENRFVVTSDAHTRHARQAAANPSVAGSVVLESRMVGKLQGLQFTATMRPTQDDDAGVKARAAYLKRFPYAAMAELNLWTIEPGEMKLTDNRLGFGKKLHWTK